VQKYIKSQALSHGVPVIPNYSLDQAIGAVIDLVVGAMTGRAEGSPGTEPATNVAQMDRVGGSSSEAVAPVRER